MWRRDIFLSVQQKKDVSLLTDFSQSTQTIENNNDTVTSNHKHSIVGVGIGVGVGVGLHCGVRSCYNDYSRHVLPFTTLAQALEESLPSIECKDEYLIKTRCAK